jgi:hypothetical protein
VSFWQKVYEAQTGKKMTSTRSQRARELGDVQYREERQEKNWEDHPSVSGDNVAKVLGTPRSTGAKHITAAKFHVQQAIERAKKGEHLNIGEE